MNRVLRFWGFFPSLFWALVCGSPGSGASAAICTSVMVSQNSGRRSMEQLGCSRRTGFGVASRILQRFCFVLLSYDTSSHPPGHALSRKRFEYQAQPYTCSLSLSLSDSCASFCLHT
ncbi:hypothetical protein V8C26DRAFT_180493 [Trichoderma gracile]